MGINGGDILGSTHIYNNISDPKQCQMRCQHNLECNYFVLDLINFECFLKRSDAGKIYKLGHISGPKSCGKESLIYIFGGYTAFFKYYDSNILLRQAHFSIPECFEVTKDVTAENLILHEKTILSSFECYNMCTNNTGCNFYIVNHRDTQMRGCWLLSKDPHFEDSTQQSLIIGSDYCSKSYKCLYCTVTYITGTTIISFIL